MNSSPSPAQPALDKSGQRVQNMFAQIAPRYDLMNHVLSLGIDIGWRKKAVKMLRFDQDLPILDCCTGTGDLALAMAKHVQGRVEVVGSDFCAPMLDLAREKHQKQCEDLPMRFVEADAQQLPFDDQAFQVVTVAFGLRNVQDTQRGIDELIRVCAPGGQVCVLEFSKPSVPGLKQLYQWYFTKVLPRIGQRFAKNNQDAYDYLPNSVVSFPSGKQLAEQLERSGLENVTVTPLTFGVASIYLGTRPAS